MFNNFKYRPWRPREWRNNGIQLVKISSGKSVMNGMDWNKGWSFDLIAVALLGQVIFHEPRILQKVLMAISILIITIIAR